MNIDFNYLRRCYRIIKETPTANVKLDRVRSEDDQGNVIGCGVGLCLGRPEFADRGVTFEYTCEFQRRGGYPVIHKGEDSGGYSFAALHLFGLPLKDGNRLFTSMRSYEEQGVPAKEVLLHRLEEFFAEHGQPLVVEEVAS